MLRVADLPAEPELRRDVADGAADDQEEKRERDRPA